MNKLRALYSTARSLLVALAASGAVSAPAAMAQATPEEAAWQAARTAGTVEALQRYLEAYPVGAHAGEAFRMIVQLAEAPADTLIEPAAGAGETVGSAAGDLY